jgi:putative methyltransferase (TIGR04325 family)
MRNFGRSLGKALLDEVPMLRSLVDYHITFPRRTTAVRGVFSSREEAEQSMPAAKPKGYDQPQIMDAEDVSQLTAKRELGAFNEHDYPVLHWLCRTFSPDKRVFNLGGNIGVEYFAFERFMPMIGVADWSICEIPSIAERGRDIAEKLGKANLTFTSEIKEGDGADIFLTIGTLQYLAEDMKTILASYTRLPRHILINTVPARDGPSYWTTQNIGYAFVPYRVFSVDEMKADLESLGYQLIDRWKFPRAFKVPYHRDHDVSHYHGFYFALPGAACSHWLFDVNQDSGRQPCEDVVG